MSEIKSRLEFVDETVAALKPVIADLEAENATLTARITELETEISDKWRPKVLWHEVKRRELEAARARLAAALAWYGDTATRIPKWVNDEDDPTDRPVFDSPMNLDLGRRARAALTADDRALAERWLAMEEEHRTCQEWLSFIEAHDNDADADWESLESENVKRELAWRAAVRAVSALAASLGG